jgi:hypothetical protein
MARGVKLDRTAGSRLQIDSGIPSASTPGNFYIDSNTGNIYVRRSSSADWQLAGSSGAGVEDTVSTINATLTPISTVVVTPNTMRHIRATVMGRQTNSANESNSYILDFTVKNNGGTATIVQFQNTYTGEDVAGWNVSVQASGGNALIQVTGAVGDNVNWKSYYQAIEV